MIKDFIIFSFSFLLKDRFKNKNSLKKMILEVSIAKSERWEEKRKNMTKFTYYFGFHSIAKNIEGRLKI
jgi:hypothetical protein